MNISPQQIVYILSLIEHKNFGKAAEVCFVTQPTLSMQIKKAEESLGFLIFDRKRNPLELSPLGKKIAPILYDMQAEFEKLKRITQENAGKINEEIKIGIIPTVASYLIPSLFENKELFSTDFHWKFKELKSEVILEQLANKKIDFGIMAGPISEEILAQTSLYNEEILIYSPEFVSSKIIESEELKNLQPWLLNAGNCLRTQMMHFCSLADENSANWNYEGGNLEIVIRMVEKYGGYTLIPAFYSDYYKLNTDFIHQLHGQNKDTFPARNIIAVSSPKNRNHPAIQELIKFIKVTYANQELKKLEILKWK